MPTRASRSPEDAVPVDFASRVKRLAETPAACETAMVSEQRPDSRLAGLERARRVVAAKVDRSELRATTKDRCQMRLLELRGTFVTVNLATGRPRRGFRANGTPFKSDGEPIQALRAHVVRAGLGTLKPMHEVIPELAVKLPKPAPTPPEGGGEEEPEPTSDLSPERKAPPRTRGLRTKTSIKTAERARFELAGRLHAHMISSHAPSATRSPLQSAQT